METPSDTDRGPGCVLFSAALHAAAFGLVLLMPPGSDALALDAILEPQPALIVRAMIAPSPTSAPSGRASSARAGALEHPTPSTRGARPRTARAPVDAHALISAIAGSLRASSANMPVFVAAEALVGPSSMVPDVGLDMIGTGRGASTGHGDTIGGPAITFAFAAGHAWTCSGDELATRTRAMGRIAAVASCDARPGGVGMARASSGRSAPNAPDAIEGSPAQHVGICRCGSPWDTSGSLAREVVRRAIAHHRTEIRGCYESALQHRPDLEGRVTATWMIAPSGGVQNASIDGERTDVHDASLVQCVTRAVSRWTFPSAGGPTLVSYPFVLGTDA